jgi:non-ribosomal peptide synthetase component F
MASTFLDILRTNNMKPNQDGDWIIAVCMKPSDNLITTLLAIWKCGAAYLPLDVTFPANRIQHILNEAKPILVICDDNYENFDVFESTKSIKYCDLKKQSLTFSNANIDENDTLTAGFSDLGLVLYTSGSTGVPKGVRLPHAIIQNRLQWQWERFPYSPTEAYGIFKTALTFVDSVSEIWGPLLNGMTLVIVPKYLTRDPQKLVDILDMYKIERLVLVPTLLRSLLMFLSLQEYDVKKPLYNLKIWVCSGEPLSLQLSREFFDYFEEGTHILCNFYGSTEVMGDVTYFVCESKKQLDNIDRVPIGYAVDNTVIYLLDKDFRPVKGEDIGELFVSGLNLAQGYVNGRDPDRFIENPLAVDPRKSKF